MPPSPTIVEQPLVSLVLHKFSRGGSDRVAAYLARGFSKAGFPVELVVFARGVEVEHFLLDLLGDIPVRFIGGRATRFRVLDLLAGLPAFVRYLRRQRPGVIVSTANNTALISAVGRALAGLRDARLVLKTTNPIASSRHRGLVRRLRLWSYRQVFRTTDEVWTLSEEESAEMAAEFPAFAHIFHAVAQPYVTDAMIKSPVPARKAAGPLILSIARMTRQKRLDRLLRAFAHVQDKDARLLILGEGEDRSDLEALSRELGIAQRVTMPGYLPDVARALHEADLFVLTSEYEGLPAAVLEAMAANCPVLSTSCFPSAGSLIGETEGCAIIDSIEPQALARQIDFMLKLPRPTSLVDVASRYSVPNGMAGHVEALRRVVNEAIPRRGTQTRTR